MEETRNKTMICFFFCIAFSQQKGKHGRNSFRTPQCTISHQKVDTLHSSITQEMRAICLYPGSPYTCPPARSSFATVNSTDWGLGPHPPSNALRRMPRCDDQHSADQSTYWVGQVGEALYAGNKKGILSLICGVDIVFLTNQ